MIKTKKSFKGFLHKPKLGMSKLSDNLETFVQKTNVTEKSKILNISQQALGQDNH